MLRGALRVSAWTRCRMTRKISTDGNPKKQSYFSRIARYLRPAPPLLARYPRVYRAFRAVRYVVAAFLGYHIFVTYFYAWDGTYGISMMPTFNSFGDSVIISKYYRRGRGVEVGDVVSYKIPFSDENGIKRVLGMPGDFVLRDTPGKSPVMIQIPEGHCWLAGDNLTYSRDSRMFGPLPLALISGKVVARKDASAWIPQRLQRILQHAERDCVREIGSDDS